MELTANAESPGQSNEFSPVPDVVISGGLIRKAEIKDEEWLHTSDSGDPVKIIASLQSTSRRADYFTFFQKLPDIQPRYSFPLEWDNVAAINTARFNEWWEGLPQEARKNVRRSAKRGVVVRVFELTDEMIRGIVSIYNETPVRQGRPFSHYGKDFETVKREVSTLPGTSMFIGAFCGEELIGFIKLISIGEISSVLHIVSKNQHYDKRPSNALITKAAELCRDQGVLWLTYGKYVYGNKLDNPLTEFKRRTGFSKVLIPRYYLPLTLRGRVFLALGLHRGLIGILPPFLVSFLLKVRSMLVQRIWLPSSRFLKRSAATPDKESPEPSSN